MMHAGSPGSPALSWRIKRRPGFTMIELIGDLNENTDLRPLVEGLSGPIVLHLGGVRRINSSGTREWVNFIRVVSAQLDVTLTHCSPAVVLQLNSIYNFRGQARIRSLLAPYLCEACDLSEDKLLDVSRLLEHKPLVLPEFHCARCGRPLELDEVPERYLGFLHDPGFQSA
jgi:anti-anti-sigma regulatory factor